MSHHTKFRDEANVSQEKDFERSHEDECKFLDDILDLEEAIQDFYSTIPTNNSTAPLSPLQSSAVSDSPSGSSASREWQGNSRMEPVAGPSYVTSRIVTESQSHSHLPTAAHGYQNPLMVSRNHTDNLPVAATSTYSFTSPEQQMSLHVQPSAGPSYACDGGNITSLESENYVPTSNLEHVPGSSYVKSGINTTFQNYLHLSSTEHDHHKSPVMSRHHSKSLPTAEMPNYLFTSQEYQSHSYTKPAPGHSYGRVSGNTVTQDCDNSFPGPSYVPHGIIKAYAEFEHSFSASVSLYPENFESEERIYSNELEIHRKQSYSKMKSHEHTFRNENSIPNSIRSRLPDDDSRMQNAVDPSRMLHFQKYHLSDRMRSQLNAESYEYNTASYAPTHASKLTYHKGNCEKGHIPALPKNLSSPDSGVTSEINFSTSSTLSIGGKNDSCVTNISKIKDIVPQINPTSTASLGEINYSTAHGASELSENSASNRARSLAIILEMQNPHDAQSQQMNYDPRILKYQVTSNECGCLFRVQKNESGRLSMLGLNNTQTPAESENLIQHKRIHHIEKAFICDVCEKEFNRKDQLENHKKIHTAENSLKCDFCEKEFKYKGKLTIHKRFHTGERRYICNICGKGFHISGNLKQHYTTHTGEKPFKCDVCNKCYSQKWVLTEHKRIHDENPFICDVCKKTFNWKDSLRSHKKIHTD